MARRVRHAELLSLFGQALGRDHVTTIKCRHSLGNPALGLSLPGVASGEQWIVCRGEFGRRGHRVVGEASRGDVRAPARRNRRKTL